MEDEEDTFNNIPMKTPNQTNLHHFICRRVKPLTQAITLAQSLAVIFTALAAPAQTKPITTSNNTTVSTAEVEAFTKALKQTTNGAMPPYMSIPANPKRVPLLLAAIERETAGPWVYYLQGFCFGVEHSGAFRLPPASRSQVYAQAIEHLTAARMTVA